ncbi:ketohexokinase-like protein [Corynespora cassiicola Philippines]|uniref:Ketohexokinase-like protein n=1 Tax=Corynespora cassiicola Philippines TaxID=1448308 RepID=A0A2T2NY90_CORCC|nr:ketohexokinase-like protein [Corynespora cassiicola Philippines]
MTQIVCVGAVYIDTILTVPHFPKEDEKLRASKLIRRRGGNCANSLEVISQLISHETAEENDPEDTEPAELPLHLVSVFPDKKSDDVGLIRNSLPNVRLWPSGIYRAGATEAASSYIIKSLDKDTRTIVSINKLPEMTVEEFAAKAFNLAVVEDVKEGWYHFEGRIPDITLKCVEALREAHEHRGMKISVECEKPEREGMKRVAELADVVFYSKLWAEKNGFKDAKSFLEAQLKCTRSNALLCCTWGDGGATLVQKASDAPEQWSTVTSWKQTPAVAVVDTIGAGDTFIAGMLYTLTYHADWTLDMKLQFANELAGRKVIQDGFGGLASKIFAQGRYI